MICKHIYFLNFILATERFRVFRTCLGSRQIKLDPRLFSWAGDLIISRRFMDSGYFLQFPVVIFGELGRK